MNQVSEITKRDIHDLFCNGMDIEEFLDSKRVTYPFCGRLTEIEFLKRLYNLQELPSNDPRFSDAEHDIWQHTVNNNDYSIGWIFEDERFNLMNGSDEIFLRFLCEVFHPAVRYEQGYWKEFLQKINSLLQKDGYELYPSQKISDRDVYDWHAYNPDENVLFIPFSQRNAQAIKNREIQLTIKMRARNQIFQLLDRYNQSDRETNETGWQYDITTIEMAFRDMEQFYPPKCYNNEGQYVPTNNLQEFIGHTSPYCVLDMIEFFEKYNQTNDFSNKVNTVLQLNTVPYRLENGKIMNALTIQLDKADLSEVGEAGLKKLLQEATGYYEQDNKEIAVEKLWDAFERLKTYYSPELSKKASANKIIELMGGGNCNYRELFEKEFLDLTKIGNDFRIRHHETTKIDITDQRYYDYFYKRCMALISVALQYLENMPG